MELQVPWTGAAYCREIEDVKVGVARRRIAESCQESTI
jgi:hypothetical protein